MSKWPMRGHFGHLHFKIFSMTLKTFKCEEISPLQSRSKFSRVPEDSNFPLLGVWASPSHLAQSGVTTPPFFCDQVDCLKCVYNNLWYIFNSNKFNSSIGSWHSWLTFSEPVCVNCWVPSLVDSFTSSTLVWRIIITTSSFLDWSTWYVANELKIVPRPFNL